MASPVPSRQSPAPQRPRRWVIAAGALAVLLVAYGGAVLWFSTHLGAEIEASIRSAPVVNDTRHRAD